MNFIFILVFSFVIPLIWSQEISLAGTELQTKMTDFYSDSFVEPSSNRDAVFDGCLTKSLECAMQTIYTKTDVYYKFDLTSVAPPSQVTSLGLFVDNNGGCTCQHVQIHYREDAIAGVFGQGWIQASNIMSCQGFDEWKRLEPNVLVPTKYVRIYLSVVNWNCVYLNELNFTIVPLPTLQPTRAPTSMPTMLPTYQPTLSPVTTTTDGADPTTAGAGSGDTSTSTAAATSAHSGSTSTPRTGSTNALMATTPVSQRSAADSSPVLVPGLVAGIVLAVACCLAFLFLLHRRGRQKRRRPRLARDDDDTGDNGVARLSPRRPAPMVPSYASRTASRRRLKRSSDTYVQVPKRSPPPPATTTKTTVHAYGDCELLAQQRTSLPSSSSDRRLRRRSRRMTRTYIQHDATSTAAPSTGQPLTYGETSLVAAQQQSSAPAHTVYAYGNCELARVDEKPADGYQTLVLGVGMSTAHIDGGMARQRVGLVPWASQYESMHAPIDDDGYRTLPLGTTNVASTVGLIGGADQNADSVERGRKY